MARSSFTTRTRKYGLLLGTLALAAFATSGCGEGALPSDGEPLSQTTQAVIGAYDVGVIPDNGNCPAGVEKIIIFMDDENGSPNRNYVTGWDGATIQLANTQFTFCRVDGTNFHSLVSSTVASYAVLKLGTSCPPHSLFGFSKYIDNEDSNNKNSSYGDIAPNIVNGNTTLNFCYFGYTKTPDAWSMNGFPDLGFTYGVFARNLGDVTPIATGMVHTDDEDKNNANDYDVPLPPFMWFAAEEIISNDRNTDFYMARVR